MVKPRMDLPAFVGKLLQEQDGDELREGVQPHKSAHGHPQHQLLGVESGSGSGAPMGTLIMTAYGRQRSKRSALLRDRLWDATDFVLSKCCLINHLEK